MKTSKFIFSVVLLGLVFNSCKTEDETQTTTVDFEDVALSSDSVSNGTSFTSGICKFTGDPSKFWNGGIVCSANNDTTTAGYFNQYSVIAGSGALKSKKFGIIYTSGSFICPSNSKGAFSIKSIMVANSTYAYLDMKYGSAYSKIFGKDDWFKVVIKGFKAKNQTSSTDVYLADFRNGKNSILKTWEKVDVSALGQVDSVAFNFESSDSGVNGINTPTYVCIDNIEFTQTISTK